MTVGTGFHRPRRAFSPSLHESALSHVCHRGHKVRIGASGRLGGWPPVEPSRPGARSGPSPRLSARSGPSQVGTSMPEYVNAFALIPDLPCHYDRAKIVI